MNMATDMSDALTDILTDGEHFQLLAAADRSAFVLRSKSDFYVAYLRGDDALRFEADYLAIRQQYPAWQSDQALAQFWDEGGYMWLAAQEAE